MQAWLDWYASQTIAHYRRADEIAKERGDDFLYPDLDNPGVALRWTCEQSIDMLQRFKREDALLAQLPYGFRETMIFQGCYILPYASTDIDDNPPFAAALDHQAVNDLAEANITDDVRELGKASATEYSRIYLDLAHHAYMLGTSQVQLRSLFVFPDIDNKRGIAFAAIFTNAGSNVGVRVIWQEDQEALGIEQQAHGMCKSFSEGSQDILYGRESIFDAAMRDGQLDLQAVLAEIEDFTWLTLAYLKTEQENRPAPFERLPHVAANDPRRGGRKARQVAKKFTLFSILKVTGTTVERDPPDKEPSSRQIGRRHQVRGHFKLQAFGPRWSQRKLLWIAPFSRGDKDSTPITPIRILTSANDNGLGGEAA